MRFYRLPGGGSSHLLQTLPARCWRWAPAPSPGSPEAGGSLGSPSCKLRLASTPAWHTEILSTSCPCGSAHHSTRAHSTHTPPTGPQNQPQPCRRPSTKAPERGHSRHRRLRTGAVACPRDPAPGGCHRRLQVPVSKASSLASVTFLSTAAPQLMAPPWHVGPHPTFPGGQHCPAPAWAEANSTPDFLRSIKCLFLQPLSCLIEGDPVSLQGPHTAPPPHRSHRPVVWVLRLYYPACPRTAGPAQTQLPCLSTLQTCSSTWHMPWSFGVLLASDILSLSR